MSLSEINLLQIYKTHFLFNCLSDGLKASGLQYRSDICREPFPGLGLSPSDLLMVTAIWYLSISNTERLSSASWELGSFKERLQSVQKPFRPAPSVQSEKRFLFSLFLAHKSEIIKKKEWNYSFYLTWVEPKVFQIICKNTLLSSAQGRYLCSRAAILQTNIKPFHLLSLLNSLNTLINISE